jgi:nucleoside-diphosphate-sugar epimerase
MTHENVTILGINGHLGHAIAQAMQAAGWQVTGFGRSNKQPVPGVMFHQGDAGSASDIAAAIAGADVVVNALNLPYPDWYGGRAEAQLATVLKALGTSGKTLLFPGNVYNYAASDRRITPDLPQRPETPRGEIRVRMEEMLAEAAARGDIQAIILTAGDFFGPEASNDWFDLVMLREAGKRRFARIGAPGVKHSWAYLPDLARAFEKLAWHRAEFGAFERFHFAGHFVTPEEMTAAVVAAAPVPLKVSNFPRFIFTAMGLFDPMMREIGKMGYLWDNPMQLVDPRLDAILGPDFGTPLDEAVAATIPRYFPAAALAA